MEPSLKATLRGTREHNERLVLATIYDSGPISRADVARLTGLTRTTVSLVVDRLIDTGMAVETGRGPSTGGKAPILLEVPPTARLLVGVDLGDQVFTAAVTDLRGAVLRRQAVPSADVGGTEAVRLATDLIREVVAGADRPVLGIGVGAPGLVDVGTGTVVRSVARDWRMLPLGPAIASDIGLPVHVANDSQASVLAEHVFGAGRGPNLIVVKVGLGIGAGYVLNGELFPGDGYGAGEIGHTIVRPDGRACRCGRRGCLETVASVGALLGAIEAATDRRMSLPEAVDAFRAGDAAVRAAVVESGRELGHALASLVDSLHVRRIVLAGSMAAFGVGWLEAVAAAALGRAFEPLASDTVFELGQVDDVVVLGAAAMVMTRELGLTLQPFATG